MPHIRAQTPWHPLLSGFIRYDDDHDDTMMMMATTATLVMMVMIKAHTCGRNGGVRLRVQRLTKSAMQQTLMIRMAGSGKSCIYSSSPVTYTRNKSIPRAARNPVQQKEPENPTNYSHPFTPKHTPLQTPPPPNLLQCIYLSIRETTALHFGCSSH